MVDSAGRVTGQRRQRGHSYDITGLLVVQKGHLASSAVLLFGLLVPQRQSAWSWPFSPDVVAACMAVSAILAAGYIPTALEVMDATTMLAVNLAQNANLPSSAGAALIIEIDGVIDGLDDTMSEIATLCHRHGAFELTTATTPEAQEQLWLARRSAFASFHTLAPSFYLVDTVVPRTRLPAMMAHIQRLSQHYGMPIANVFHAGDG
jgi:FAD/FMN-containing dehydrogenase